MAETKARGGIAKPVTPSPELAKITGSADLPRSEVVSKLWDYIKKNNLQNPANKREIIADDTLRPIFGTDKVTMFEMNKHIAKHVKYAGRGHEALPLNMRRAGSLGSPPFCFRRYRWPNVSNATASPGAPTRSRNSTRWRRRAWR